jgi:hypothetical protein
MLVAMGIAAATLAQERDRRSPSEERAPPEARQRISGADSEKMIASSPRRHDYVERRR